MDFALQKDRSQTAESAALSGEESPFVNAIFGEQVKASIVENDQTIIIRDFASDVVKVVRRIESLVSCFREQSWTIDDII